MNDSHRQLRIPVLVALAVTAMLVAPATADWIVLKDGERIETRGPWEVKGSRILFTSRTGALTSLRASEVDLDASDRANRPAPVRQAERERATPTSRPKPALVLDDTNVARARRIPSSSDAEVSSDPADSEPAGTLTVASWQETRAGVDGLRFGGVLENPTGNFAVLVAVKATLSDSEGNVLATANATLPAASVGPHETQTFEVAFPSTFTYSDVAFDVSYKFLKGAPDTSAPTPAIDDDSPEADDASAPDSEPLQPTVG